MPILKYSLWVSLKSACGTHSARRETRVGGEIKKRRPAHHLLQPLLGIATASIRNYDVPLHIGLHYVPALPRPRLYFSVPRTSKALYHLGIQTVLVSSSAGLSGYICYVPVLHLGA